MPISDRINNWVDDRRKAWGGALANFLFSAIAQGVTKSLEDMEPGAINGYRASLTKLRDNPLIPPELRQFYDQALKPGNPISVVGGMLMMIVQSLGVVLGGSEPLANLVKYSQEQALKTYRLDPLQAIATWRRDKAQYANIFADLKDQGWDDSRIAALKFVTEIIPGVGDLVRMAVREAFTPEIAEKFGQYEDYPDAVTEWGEKQGLSQEWLKRYWAAHWDLPSSLQGIEMFRRTTTEPTRFSGNSIGTVEGKPIYRVVSEDNLKLLLRALDIMPPWRDALIQIAWEIPTRVDVRRFWDMRTISEDRLREIYGEIGYHGKDLDDYVLWTKVFGAFPELLARYKNGWLTLDEVKAELVAMGMPAARVDEMIEEKIKKAAPERVAGEKNLTKTDIFKGVKQARITRAQGQELLMDLGYDPAEATYLLDINIPPDAEDTAVTERQLTKADILSGLKAAIISREEARTKLLELRYSTANADLLLKLYDAQLAPPTETRLKEASKADIVLGVKKGLITPEEGYLMLLDIDFSPEASLFILTVQTEESPFSPINFAEFKDLTQHYRKASGLEGTPMNENIRAAAKTVILLTGERDAIQLSLQQEQRLLISEDILPATATTRLNELKVTLRKAEAALAAARSEYGRLVAELKHATP